MTALKLLIATFVLAVSMYAHGGDICLSSFCSPDNRYLSVGGALAPKIIASDNIHLSIGNLVTEPPTVVASLFVPSITPDMNVVRYTIDAAANTIHIDGNLYVDYSFLSSNPDSNISGNFTFNGAAVSIFSYNEAPIFPSTYNTQTFDSDTFSFGGTGNWVIFSKSPFASGTLEATGNLYIGNYSPINPVPLPASFYLFLSGLVLFFCLITFRKYATNNIQNTALLI